VPSSDTSIDTISQKHHMIPYEISRCAARRDTFIASLENITAATRCDQLGFFGVRFAIDIFL